MPCLCSSPERKSTSNPPKRTRLDGMAIAMGACVAREYSTAVRLVGGLAHCLGLKLHLFGYLHRKNHFSRVPAFSHCLKAAAAPTVGCQAGPENASREEGKIGWTRSSRRTCSDS